MERTIVTFAPEAGVMGNCVFWHSTMRDACDSITRAIDNDDSWWIVPGFDGGNDVYISRCALQYVASVATVLMQVQDAPSPSALMRN